MFHFCVEGRYLNVFRVNCFFVRERERANSGNRDLKTQGGIDGLISLVSTANTTVKWKVEQKCKKAGGTSVIK